MSDILKRAREVLTVESRAVKDQLRHLDSNFEAAVESLHAISQSGGQVIVVGMGKSGLIARKISATLSSTGTPSFFFHPAEGMHGDLGMIRTADALLVLSVSGETDEIRKILPMLKARARTLIAVTAVAKSRLARAADRVISCAIRKEACPFNLTPTASTTVMLALGDAIAMALMELKGFKSDDFARLHPSGSLGKKLLMKVGDLMHQGKENPVIRDHCTVREALLEMTRTRLGAANVVDRAGKLVGFFTDGDLRRHLQKDAQLLSKPLSRVMTRRPSTISPEHTLHEALNLLKSRGFDNIPVVDKSGKPVGLLDERDLLAEGVS